VITGLDHVVVLTGDINAASAAYQTLFARAPAWQYGGDGADRVLFTLDNTTLELMAPSGEGASADRIRSVLAAQGEGLASICFRTSDIGKMHRRLDRLTLKPDAIAEVESRDAVSGATSVIYQADAISSATTFSDTRHEGTLGLGFHGRRSRISFSATVGTERDYLSRQIGGSASIDLPGRNTTVALAYSHSFDQVCDKDNGMLSPQETKAMTGADPCDKSGGIFGKDRPGTTLWRDLSIDTVQATLTQNLSPTMNLQIAGYGQVLEGFQSNPYRRVRIGQNSPQEHIPSTRDRLSISARLNRFLPRLHPAVHFDARFYDDTWGVVGGDVELGYSQYIGKSLLLKLHARVYQQAAAKFFKDAFYYQTLSTAGEYFTGDRELSPVRNATLGGKLTLITIGGDKPIWGLFDKLQVNLKADILMLDVLAADNLADNPMGVDKQFIYGNSLVDAVILQLGLTGNY
jgi:catechol 2,3-dioxygenase-like lactoylglutathione lyase family enzyme